MRVSVAVAPILFGLFCTGAQALDDTPTYAPYLSVKGEDGRTAIRPVSVPYTKRSMDGDAIRRDAKAVPVAHALATPSAAKPVVQTPIPVVEKPSWKLQ